MRGKAGRAAAGAGFSAGQTIYVPGRGERMPILRCFLVHFLAWLLGLLAMPAGAGGIELQSAWMASGPGWTEADVPGPDDPRWQRFDSNRSTAVPRLPDGAWIRLQPVHEWPRAPLVLGIEAPPLGEFVLHAMPGWSRASSSMNTDRLRGHGPGRIAFELPADLDGSQALLLNLRPYPSVSGGITITVEDRAAFVARDARWFAFLSACLAVMLAMALMALFFAIFLRDVAFLFYALYLLCYVLIQGVQTGYVAVPLGWTLIAGNPLPWGLGATCFAIVFAALFANRFIDLARHAPRLRQALLVLVAGVCVVLLGGWLLPQDLQYLRRGILNPLIVIAGPFLMACGVVAALRGSRYARYFLIGWTPLLVLTVMSSLQLFGVLRDWPWIGDACIVAAVFEALVLSVGLADRALALRRDRDRITLLAERDPLTAILNRRAWMERAGSLVHQAHASGSPLCLLFLDIDDFKQINDRMGHEAGDTALVNVARLIGSVLRPEDQLGRYGGEEFVAVLPRCDVARALRIAERLCTSVQTAAIPGVSEGSVLTLSIGVAEIEPGDDLARLLSRADRAMYDAKHAGRNRIHVAASASPRTTGADAPAA